MDDVVRKLTIPLLLLASTSAHCPTGFINMFSCSCYNIVQSPTTTRDGATSECEALSSHLVFIESDEEYQFLSKTYDSNFEYWLGLTETSNIWDDGSPMGYSRIGTHSTATDNNSGCYRIITDAQAINWGDEPGSWFDKSCTASYGYICEYEMDPSECQSTGCPAGFSHTFSCSCYLIVSSPTLDRDGASSECEARSSHLVFIESVEEDQFLRESCDSSNEYWLGLTDSSYPVKIWDDGSLMVYSRIGTHSTATDNNSGCYRIITDAQAINWGDESGSWFDKSCTASYGYICEYDMDSSFCQTTTTPAQTVVTTEDATTTTEKSVPTTGDVTSTIGGSFSTTKHIPTTTVETLSTTGAFTSTPEGTTSTTTTTTTTTTKGTLSTPGDITTTEKQFSTTGKTTTISEGALTNEDTTTTRESTLSTNGAVTTSTRENSSGCPEVFELQTSCSCYHVVSYSSKRRNRAKRECENLSAHLVFIESKEEQEYLSQMYDPSLQYWLGLNGLPYSTKTWDDGSIMVFSNLARHSFATDDRSGCYRIISDSKAEEWCVGRNTWIDLSCNLSLPYICEYDLDGKNCTYELPTPATPAPEIDAGELFGVDKVDVTLSESYHVGTLTKERSITSCVAKCAENNCGAIMFQHETNNCKVATLTDTRDVCKPISVFRTFSCIHGPGYDLCY